MGVGWLYLRCQCAVIPGIQRVNKPPTFTYVAEAMMMVNDDDDNNHAADDDSYEVSHKVSYCVHSSVRNDHITYRFCTQTRSKPLTGCGANTPAVPPELSTAAIQILIVCLVSNVSLKATHDYYSVFALLQLAVKIAVVRADVSYACAHISLAVCAILANSCWFCAIIIATIIIVPPPPPT